MGSCREPHPRGDFQGPSQPDWRLTLYDDLGRPVERVLLENGDGTTSAVPPRYDEQAGHSFEELEPMEIALEDALRVNTTLEIDCSLSRLRGRRPD